MAEYDEAFDFFLQCLPNTRRSIIPLYKANPEFGRAPKFVGFSVYCQFGAFVMLLTAGHLSATFTHRARSKGKPAEHRNPSPRGPERG
jgi:hypothetical protein